MKTVVERRIWELERTRDSYSDRRPSKLSDVDDYLSGLEGRSDFGARNPVKFTGFVKTGNSAFIDEIGKGFDSN